jgi:hypothetical protein
VTFAARLALGVVRAFGAEAARVGLASLLVPSPSRAKVAWGTR